VLQTRSNAARSLESVILLASARFRSRWHHYSIELRLHAKAVILYVDVSLRVLRHENLRAWETLGTIRTQRGSLVGKKIYRKVPLLSPAMFRPG
jgi:hypothetical protein